MTATFRTPEETRLNYQRHMGNDLGHAFDVLRCDIADLFEKWGDYLALFGTSQETVAVLNRTAPEFFGRYQRVLRNDIILHIARLVDPPRSVGRDNMSVGHLVEMVTDVQLKAALEPLLQRLRDETSFVKDWRNRILAHRDKGTALGEQGSNVFSNRAQKRAALVAITDVMNAICAHYCDSIIGFEFTYDGDAESLLHFLRSTDSNRPRIGQCSP